MSYDNDNDGGIRYAAEVLAQQEQEEWLSDPIEQKFYQTWLDQINGNPGPDKTGFTGDSKCH